MNLSFRYGWTSSTKYGLVRKSVITNLSNKNVSLKILDGCRNILPACVDADFQNNNSVLLDAYKKTDLDDFKQELTSSDVIINEFIDKSSFNSDRNDILTNGGILARILLNTANKSELDEILKKTKEELRETLKLVDDINDNDIIPAAITLAETTCGEIYGRSDDCE